MAEPRKPFCCRDCGVPITLISVAGRDKDYTMAFIIPPASVERDQRGWVSAVRLVVHDCPNRQKGSGGGGGQTARPASPPPPPPRPSSADEDVPF